MRGCVRFRPMPVPARGAGPAYLSLGGRAGRKIASVVSVAVDVTDLQRVERERRHLLAGFIPLLFEHVFV
jgi:hypothetical protein